MPGLEWRKESNPRSQSAITTKSHTISRIDLLVMRPAQILLRLADWLFVTGRRRRRDFFVLRTAPRVMQVAYSEAVGGMRGDCTTSNQLY